MLQQPVLFILGVELKMDTEMDAFTNVLLLFQLTDYFKHLSSDLVFLYREIETGWFRDWQRKRLDPMLDALAELSSNSLEFLDQFPDEKRKWEVMVSMREDAVRDDLPRPTNSSPDQIWKQIFTFIEDKIKNVRLPTFKENEDDRVLVGMCMRYIRGASNPFFLALINNIAQVAFYQPAHEYNAERIVGIIEILRGNWVLPLRNVVEDIDRVLRTLSMPYTEVQMRDRIIAYLRCIHRVCDSV